MLIFLFIATANIAANFYLFFKLNELFNFGTPAGFLLGTFILFMMASPVLIPIYGTKVSERFERNFSYIGYMWLAFLVPFFPVGIILDLYNLVMQYSGSLTGNDFGSLLLSSDTTFLIPVVLSVAINIYGYFEAQNLRIERLVVNTSKLPEGEDRVRIAQISDLHLGIIVRDKILDRVIKKIGDEKPDLIVSTGDLVDGNIRHIDHFAVRLKGMKARYGKYAVMGNHEVYGGVRQTIGFIENAGFKLLRGNGVTINDTINIAGMDFSGGEAHGYSRQSGQKQEHQVLTGLREGLFTLSLKHRSDVREESLGLFDLQLSGHTHKGQIFPMNLATMFIFQHHTGFIKLAKGSAIYVSRGTGTAGPPIRFLSTPEITVIDIVNESKS
jgi:predicted MPP superfamily phosphohydrolase